MSTCTYSVASSCEYNRKSSGGSISTSPVQVAVRVKPLSDDELLSDLACIKVHDNENSIRIVNNNNNISKKRNGSSPRHRVANLSSSSNVFTFDGVFSGNSIEETERIFVKMIEPVIEDTTCTTGCINASVLLYGEQGSGKTSCLTSSEYGIIPRSLARIFRSLNYKKARESREIKYDFQISIQCVEVFNKGMVDLLALDPTPYLVSNQSLRSGKTSGTNGQGIKSTTKLSLRGWNTDSPYIDGAVHEIVLDVEEAMMCLEQSLDSRNGRADNNPMKTIGGHTILTVLIHQTVEGAEINSKINFVDLAAPQHFQTIGSIIPRTIQFFRDRCDINQSLLVLGIVLTTIWAEQKHNVNIKNIASIPFVPYRDSLLTSVLKGSLGTDTKTILIACITSGLCDSEKTIDTLRFANRIKGLSPHPDLLYLSTDENEIPDMSIVQNDTMTSEQKRSSPIDRHETKKTAGIKSKTVEKTNVSTPPRNNVRKEFKSPSLSLSPGSAHKTAPVLARKNNRSIATSAPLTAASPANYKKTKTFIATRETTPVKQPVTRAVFRTPTNNKGSVPAVSIKNKVKPFKATSIVTPKSASIVTPKSTPVRMKPQPVTADPDPSEFSDLLDALLDPSESKRGGEDFEMSGLLDALLDPPLAGTRTSTSLFDGSLIDTKSDHTITFDLSVTIRPTYDNIDGQDELFGVNLVDGGNEGVVTTVPAIDCADTVTASNKHYFSESETESSPTTSEHEEDVTPVQLVPPSLPMEEIIIPQSESTDIKTEVDTDGNIVAKSLDQIELNIASTSDTSAPPSFLAETTGEEVTSGTVSDDAAMTSVTPTYEQEGVADVAEIIGSDVAGNENVVCDDIEDQDADDLLDELLDDGSDFMDNDTTDHIPVDDEMHDIVERGVDTADMIGNCAADTHLLLDNSDPVSTSLKVAVDSNINESKIIEPETHEAVSDDATNHSETYQQTVEHSFSAPTTAIVEDTVAPSELVISPSAMVDDNIEDENSPPTLANADNDFSNWKEKVDVSASCENTVQDSVAMSFGPSILSTSTFDETDVMGVAWHADNKPFHIGDIQDPALDTRLSRKNMLFTRATLREAVDKSNKSLESNGLPEVTDIPPLPMNNEDLTRLLKASGLILNEHGDFALPSSKFSKEVLSNLSEEEIVLHQNNKLYRLVGLWECRWKDTAERRVLRQKLSKHYSLTEVEILDPVLEAAESGDRPDKVAESTTSVSSTTTAVPTTNSEDISFVVPSVPEMAVSVVSMEAEADLKEKAVLLDITPQPKSFAVHEEISPEPGSVAAKTNSDSIVTTMGSEDISFVVPSVPEMAVSVVSMEAEAGLKEKAVLLDITPRQKTFAVHEEISPEPGPVATNTNSDSIVTTTNSEDVSFVVPSVPEMAVSVVSMKVEAGLKEKAVLLDVTPQQKTFAVHEEISPEPESVATNTNSDSIVTLVNVQLEDKKTTECLIDEERSETKSSEELPISQNPMIPEVEQSSIGIASTPTPPDTCELSHNTDVEDLVVKDNCLQSEKQEAILGSEPEMVDTKSYDEGRQIDIKVPHRSEEEKVKQTETTNNAVEFTGRAPGANFEHAILKHNDCLDSRLKSFGSEPEKVDTKSYVEGRQMDIKVPRQSEEEKGKQSETTNNTVESTARSPGANFELAVLVHNDCLDSRLNQDQFVPISPVWSTESEAREKSKSDKKNKRKPNGSDENFTQQEFPVEISPNTSDRSSSSRSSMSPTDDIRPEQSKRASNTKVTTESTRMPKKDNIATSEVSKKGFGKLFKGFLKR